MNILLVRFSIRLYDGSDPSDEWGPHGPVFHRWLPDGENDAIELPTDDPSASVRVWIERRGKTAILPKRILYDEYLRDVNAEVMAQQGALHAGILSGELKITDVSDEDIAPLLSTLSHPTDTDQERSVEYVPLGKRVDRLIVSAVAPFIERLRFTYGQYWIKPLHTWDATKDSIGQHFMNYGGAVWSLDDGQKWRSFRPGRNIIYLRGAAPDVRTFKQYLTRMDWLEIASSEHTSLPVSFAAEMAHETQRLLDDRQHRFAVIQAITALEVALTAYFDSKRTDNEEVRRRSQQLRNTRGRDALPLDLRLCIATFNLDSVSPEDVEAALRAIQTRNDAVHEGYQPSAADLEHLRGTLRVIAALLEQPHMRFVSRHVSQLIVADEVWDAADE